MAFLDILPDPNISIKNSGKVGGGSDPYGPGFVSVKLASNLPVAMNRTNSGRSIQRSLLAHSWSIDITYNQLTRDEFEPINSFLMHRYGQLRPFYVILPQYANSRDTTFSSYTNPDVSPYYAATFASAETAGTTSFTISLSSSAGSPKPGDIFNVVDTENSNHVKAYSITAVETNADYHGSQPTTGQRILHIYPALTYSVTSGSTLKFYNPTFRVIPKADVQEYSLGVNNLYQFNLSLEEALP